jgi:hypothetical protein
VPIDEPSFISLTDQFAVFADSTVALPVADRVTQFRQRLGSLFPGFYEPRWRDEAGFVDAVSKALAGFPSIRAEFTVASDRFAGNLTTASSRFRRFFPEYRLTTPIYLVHSLGEMDGGTRTIDGRDVMVFGADVIARIHDSASIGPFLDHELFHLYHAQYFDDADELWCNLWREGLATYVAAQLNPGADDRQLGLTEPRPIRAAVDARLTEAMSVTRSRLDSHDETDLASFFLGYGTAPIVPRFGYYVGYLVVERIGADRTLDQLARIQSTDVRSLIEETLDSFID